jgi:AcrR family transcriptional regulator
VSRSDSRQRHRARAARAPDLPVWVRPAPGERRPAYTREQIVATALDIADNEGFEAVSMRRIATELGAGTMTLYHYVRTRDELTALMGEAIMGELVIPEDELPDGWRDGMAEIARRTRTIFTRHPWIVEHLDDGDDGPSGPNALRHFEQSLAVASRTGLGIEEQLELVALVDDYVFGYAIRARGGDPMFDDTEEARERLDTLLEYVDAQLQTGQFPHIAELAGDDPRESFYRIARLTSDEERFERGLQRLLDGIELGIERRG